MPERSFFLNLPLSLEIDVLELLYCEASVLLDPVPLSTHLYIIERVF